MSTHLQLWPTLVGVAALLFSVVIALLAEGFIVAGSPNSSPAQLRHLKLAMLAIAAGTLVCATASIVLMTRHHPWTAAGVAATPAVILTLLFTALLIAG